MVMGMATVMMMNSLTSSCPMVNDVDGDDHGDDHVDHNGSENDVNESVGCDDGHICDGDEIENDIEGDNPMNRMMNFDGVNGHDFALSLTLY